VHFLPHKKASNLFFHQKLDLALLFALRQASHQQLAMIVLTGFLL
jgi:hypothetical protein